MKGKTVVATGATSGIGEAGVLELAKMGARIVLVARDERQAEATLNALEARAPRLGHSVHLADLSSMAETRRVGLAIAASERRIDVLIKVALGDNLAASTPARIVSIASATHPGASLDFADLRGAKGFSGLKA